MSNIVDLEKYADSGSTSPIDDEKIYGVSTATAISGEVEVVKRGKYLQKAVNFMNRMGGEERGIERVLPHEKTDQKPFDNFSVWYTFPQISYYWLT